MAQPFISILVNPIHIFCLRIGAIRPHAPPRSSTSSSLSSVVSIPGVDMNDMERRRQIALKALNERLSRTTDASRQHILPKSFPHSHHHQHQHQHQHQHHGHHNHGHHHGGDGGGGGGQPPFIAPPKVPMSYTIPAIPLPPPPSMVAPVQPNQLVSATIVPATETSIEQNAQNTQSASNLIDLNVEQKSDSTPQT